MRTVARLLLLSFGILATSLLWGPSSVGAQNNQANRKGTVVTLDGLKSQTPADWVEEPTTSQMRVKQFRLPAVANDKDNAELTLPPTPLNAALEWTFAAERHLIGRLPLPVGLSLFAVASAR